MAYLAPDIIVAIIEGGTPPACCFENLKQGVPTDWAEQRRLLGFPSLIS
ncbi:MAG: hypothetical protein ABFS23_00635 [Pseudomonadota bacterium]